ncbi:L-arabinose-binding periplasmic protein [Spirochaetia bacterium]|nr:L-arabinose-binding periplasmic protein [Spirochaetia bacterium]GHV80587.1 L-arabinose-binding periplasmic protein [Spirochaetia bacterium]
MKKLSLVLVLVLAASFVFAGGGQQGSSAKKDGPLLAFICKDLSQEWFVGTSTAMRNTAIARGARDMLLLDTAMNPDKYMTALDAAIAQKVDVLIVCPPDQKLSQITVDRCKAAGIKVMADDDGLINEQGVHIAPALELDAYKVGQGIGEYLGNYYNKNNMAANAASTGFMLMNMPEVSSCVPRSEGARDTFFASVPGFDRKKLIVADYDGTSEKGFNVAAATITANPQYTTWIVMAPNDEGAQGATRALEQANLDKNAIVAGVGGYLAKDEFKKSYSAFKATAYIDPALDGQLAGDAAMDWIQNGKEPYAEYKKPGEAFGVYPFSATMIDATNYKQIMGAGAN